MFFVSGLNTGAARLSEISLGKVVSLSALGLYNRARSAAIIAPVLTLAGPKLVLTAAATASRRPAP